MTLERVSLLFLFFHMLAPLLYTTSHAALLQAINCSTSDNYTDPSDYAANVHQFLAALPENAVSKNGGFYNGTVGAGLNTVYGLAMCPADYSRADCGDCLAATGLPNSCPGSRAVIAMFDRCLVRYSNVYFFGTPEIGVVLALSGEGVAAPGLYSPKVAQALNDNTDRAVVSPQRFAASAGQPFVFVQCTWDLPADKCKQCLNVLSANTSGLTTIRKEGQRKSYSCAVRYSNTSFMVVPFTAAPGPTPQSIDQTGTPTASSRSTHSKAETVGGAVGGVFAVACLGALSLCVYKLRRQRNTQDLRKFSYSDLAGATSNFGEGQRLGAGAFGTVYRGQVEGIRVAIKKIIMTIPEQKVTIPVQVPIDKAQRRKQEKEHVEQMTRDFYNEMKIMSPLHHRNIIRLLGWCREDINLCLVYELMENGSLEGFLYPEPGTIDSDLHGITTPGTILLLDWQKRHNILIGIATGLVYLHCECGERVLHRDIKPANVLLDTNFNAKLCDFGLVTQFSHNHTSRSTANVRGTPFYIDPAYVSTTRACQQNDIYSFGILLLEIVCCERPRAINETTHNLIQKVSTCYMGNQILNAADTRLRGKDEFDMQIVRVLMIGLSCVQPDPTQRPHIRRVLVCLTDGTAELPYFPTSTYIPLQRISESGSIAASTSRDNIPVPAVPPAQSGTTVQAASTSSNSNSIPVVLPQSGPAVHDAGVTPLLPERKFNTTRY